MTDSLSIVNLIKKINPDEIYNLPAQSHVAVSFETPEYTANVDALGTLRILEVSVRSLGKSKKIKIYQVLFDIRIIWSSYWNLLKMR